MKAPPEGLGSQDSAGAAVSPGPVVVQSADRTRWVTLAGSASSPHANAMIVEAL
ncbi:hypothetical protein [Streptomyces sp. NPDC026092]|uniref:hypothetical protein n=1 Tax=Streptomyces sp. NPDC026092 TaxID=3154797 RepID=UPI0033FAD6D8